MESDKSKLNPAYSHTDTSKVNLSDEDWKKILLEAHREDVSVIGDSRLQAGECILETSVGRVDLGVKAQLEEIEKGFFDLLQQRPA